MTVISHRQAKHWAEHIFERSLTDEEVRAIGAGERAGHKIEGYVGFVCACHIIAAYEKALPAR